jgi:hypothetical protein
MLITGDCYWGILMQIMLATHELSWRRAGKPIGVNSRKKLYIAWRGTNIISPSSPNPFSQGWEKGKNNF